MRAIFFLLFIGLIVTACMKEVDKDLFELVRYDKTDAVEQLLDKGADVDVQNIDGTTPLMVAVESGHLNMVEFLLNNGADPNIKNHDDLTALDFATRKGRRDIMQALLESHPNAIKRPRKKNGYDKLEESITKFHKRMLG